MDVDHEGRAGGTRRALDLDGEFMGANFLTSRAREHGEPKISHAAPKRTAVGCNARLAALCIRWPHDRFSCVNSLITQNLITHLSIATDEAHYFALMKAIGLMLLAASTAHGFMVSPIVRPLHPVKIASATSMIDAPSGPSLDFFINQVSAFFAGGSKEPVRSLTLLNRVAR